MKVRTKIWTIVIGCSLLSAGLLVDGGFDSGIVVSDVQAKIGWPLHPAAWPVSLAARRGAGSTDRPDTSPRCRKAARL